jgi:hypothetical protein
MSTIYETGVPTNDTHLQQATVTSQYALVVAVNTYSRRQKLVFQYYLNLVVTAIHSLYHEKAKINNRRCY